MTPYHMLAEVDWNWVNNQWLPIRSILHWSASYGETYVSIQYYIMNCCIVNILH